MTTPTPSVDLTAPNYASQLMRLGVTGKFHYGPLAAELPLNMAPYAAPWVDLGWISDAGFTENVEEERSDWTPWQSQSPERGQVTSREFTFQTVLWSIGGIANAMYYGVAESDMTLDTESGVVSFTQGEALPADFRFRLGVDVIDGTNARRFLIPNASISERGSVQYTGSDLVGYELTFKANLDHDLGFSIRREFLEGWKPGIAGTTAAAAETHDFGDWSKIDTATAPTTAPVTVTLPAATGGTFTLTVGADTTGALAYNATAATVQTAVRKLPAGTTATVTGTPGKYTLTGTTAKVTANGANLTGADTTTITVS